MPATTWHHSNRYNAQEACEHCGGVVRHEIWCISCNPAVQYAHGVVVEPDTLTLSDRLILHALGVEWQKAHCTGPCLQSTGH